MYEKGISTQENHSKLIISPTKFGEYHDYYNQGATLAETELITRSRIKCKHL